MNKEAIEINANDLMSIILNAHNDRMHRLFKEKDLYMVPGEDGVDYLNRLESILNKLEFRFNTEPKIKKEE